MIDRNSYHEAFDQLPFSSDFQERTKALLRQHIQDSEKESSAMKFHTLRKAVLLAATVAALALSVSAALYFLSPADVADHFDQPLLAEAFESKEAILLDETVQTGDYRVTLAGLVSGEGLTSWSAEVEEAHTYAVVMLQRTDGAAIKQSDFDFIAYTLTPLVSGYAPTAVNNWTLGSFATGFAQDGVFYYLLDTQDLGIFASHTVYLAFYEGGAPSNSVFTVAEDGSIDFAEDFQEAHALFTLPLDPALADDAAADAFAEGTGMNQWSNDRTVPDDAKTGVYFRSEDGEDGPAENDTTGYSCSSYSSVSD